MKFTLLNTSILTDYGKYIYAHISLPVLKHIIKDAEIQSAIGHQATAEILTELLGIPVEMNRIQYVQQVEEEAIVFKLKQRLPEGSIINREEIEKIGYEFGLLRRVE